MFEWMNRHKKDIMKYTLWLVIPSFVLMYGYGECMKPQMIRWVVKVDDAEISELAWNNQIERLRTEMQNNRENGQEADLPAEELRSRALQRSIVSALFEEKANEWGIATTDDEVFKTIHDLSYFKDEQGNFSYDIYRQKVIGAGYHPIQFEEMQRESLTRAKMQSVVTQSVFRSAADKKRNDDRQNAKIQIEYLAFEPSSYTEEIAPDEAGMQEYYDKNKEDYRIPEQRRIAYARFIPANFIQEVSYAEQQVERYFRQNQTKYELPEQVAVEHILYKADSFINDVTPTAENIETQYRQNAGKYVKPEQARVRYISVPLAAAAETQQVTDEAIEEFYKKNIARYEHPEQIKASHILLRVTDENNAEQVEAVKNHILAIRQEIVDGTSTFQQAAQKYSHDGSASKGGDLGYFGRGRMVAPFEEAAFSLPVNQISEPVKTRYGYHLIMVEEKREAGTEPLEKVRDSIAMDLKKEKAHKYFQRLADEIQSLNGLAERYAIKETPWFSKQDPIEGVSDRGERILFNQAFSNTTGKPVYQAGSIYMDNVYLIEPAGHTPSAAMTLEEARDTVVKDAKISLAEKLADQTAEADAARIKEASVPLETIAMERKMEIQPTKLFDRNATFIEGLGSRPSSVISSAFTMEKGEVRGPLKTSVGSHIIRLLTRQPSHLPEFAEVKPQAENDYKQDYAARLARSAANNFINDLFEKEDQMLEQAASMGIEAGTTDLFKENDAIPGLGYKRAVNAETFKLTKEGEMASRAAAEEQSQPSSQQQSEPEIEAFYAIRLLEIKPSYIPSLEEAQKDVERDYRLQQAEKIAVENAQKTLAAIQSLLSSSGPIEATRAVDLTQFEDKPEENKPQTSAGKGASYRGPIEITGMGQIQGIGRSPAIAKTALALNPGQISQVVQNYQMKMLPDKTRVQGKMTGAYIIQTLGKSQKEEADNDPQSIAKQIERYLEQQSQSLAFSAWVDEVSSAANIQYNDEILNPDREDKELEEK
ncbi:MAG: peptidyl-prolyl cis-trans isomerase [Candidatus Omnitrophota bacterium]